MLNSLIKWGMLPPPPKKNQRKKNIMKEIINSAILIISRLSINTFKGKVSKHWTRVQKPSSRTNFRGRWNMFWCRWRSCVVLWRWKKPLSSTVVSDFITKDFKDHSTLYICCKSVEIIQAEGFLTFRLLTKIHEVEIQIPHKYAPFFIFINFKEFFLYPFMKNFSLDLHKSFNNE